MDTYREPDPVSEEFTINDLRRVRTLVARAAQWIGLTVKALDDLVVAVNEIAINALLYAGGRARITVAACPDGMSVEISDSGPGLPSGLREERPPTDALGGRGLWLARRLCPQMTISSSPRGVTVRMIAMAPA
jgi:anti-sigma regulatory factor (Ser/Thr protein kinase)